MFGNSLKWAIAAAVTLVALAVVVLTVILVLATICALVAGAGTWTVLRFVAGPQLLELFHGEMALLALTIAGAVFAGLVARFLKL